MRKARAAMQADRGLALARHRGALCMEDGKSSKRDKVKDTCEYDCEGDWSQRTREDTF